jgi:hypothetical protein
MTPKVVTDHPAESTGPLATVVALLIAKAVGVDDAYTVGYIAIALSFVPAIITWLVDLRRGAGAASSE